MLIADFVADRLAEDDPSEALERQAAFNWVTSAAGRHDPDAWATMKVIAAHYVKHPDYNPHWEPAEPIVYA